MNHSLRKKALLLSLASVLASTTAQADSYVNFIRQVQVFSTAEWQVPVAQQGQQLSPLAIDPGGARFELWTVENSTLADHLLDHKYVGAYVPQAAVTIETEDPYVTIPRTRADRPFTVTVTLNGMLIDPSAPLAARMVKILQHVQSYGNGVGVGLDRDQATKLAEGYIGQNGTYVLNYPLTNLPGVDRSKLRGEERITINSLPDYQAPEAQLASKYVQIWPVADGAISGIEDGAQLRFSTPTLTVTLNDLYPDSRTYAQIYKGSPVLGTVGAVVPGTAVLINDAIPHDRVLSVEDWDSVIDSSGTWTLEVLTETPFGTDRLDYVSFNINRDLSVNGAVTTVE